MAPPPHQLRLHLQPPPPPTPQQKDQPTIFGNYLSGDDQIAGRVPFLTPESFTQTQPQQYPPSFVDVMGLAPGGDVGSSGWEEPARKRRVKEQELLENSQISSIDFLQTRSVSTGLGLSLDDRRVAGSSSVDSPLFPMIGDEIERELQRQDAEMDRFIKAQGERLRQTILEKVQAKQLQVLTSIEEKILCKLRAKEVEVEDVNKKNSDLQEQIKQLNSEAFAWQSHAKYNENMIMALKLNLQKVYAHDRDNREGCGDSEMDDTASCCNHVGTSLRLLSSDKEDLKEWRTCKVCRVNKVCMLLLPCRHLCLCKDCESKLSMCPICQYSKLIGMEVYM